LQGTEGKRVLRICRRSGHCSRNRAHTKKKWHRVDLDRLISPAPATISWPRGARASVWQTPQASTRILTCPKAGSTIALSTTSNLPGCVYLHSFIGPTHTLSFVCVFWLFRMQYGQSGHIDLQKLLICRFGLSAISEAREKPPL
jgi:hypothetical protein